YESRIKELEQSLYDVAKAMDNADEKAKILGTERSEDYQSAKTKEASKAYGDSLDELTEARSKADDASVAYQESVNEVRVASQAINDARLGAPTTGMSIAREAILFLSLIPPFCRYISRSRCQYGVWHHHATHNHPTNGAPEEQDEESKQHQPPV
ncbi:hypothetical protein THAOC_05589, partial [Thalassiosira oceanica]